MKQILSWIQTLNLHIAVAVDLGFAALSFDIVGDAFESINAFVCLEEFVLSSAVLCRIMPLILTPRWEAPHPTQNSRQSDKSGKDAESFKHNITL